ncbi:protein-disulfide reductase DsbD domain-containing protein [Haloferula rosea]|uniref:Thiol:disulfide interchange protein DsbD N-terminal domain-containing protein n=1 Tax=Haloferula rosea TaxID=490093 RepID=A0A934VF54_9BACT|nr:protein-disulfide reductase DsbD domain-containing protein [Haloferula rosea]MBK1826637.1 hypothetical protein [Haloferula rosea]
MTRCAPSCLAPLLLLTAGAEPPTRGIDIELIAESRSIQPGKPFTLGLAIHHHEGFHTYWQNPGIVGVPTSIEWDMPEGFQAGPIQWPTPEKVDMAGHPAHGYERDVLLMVEVTPPESLDMASCTFRASASWMACAASCHPGSRTLSTTLPVESDASGDGPDDPRFEAARSELPRPLANWAGTWQSDASGTGITIHLQPPSGQKPIESVYFFSSDGQISSDQPQTLTLTRDGGLSLAMKRCEFSPETRKVLPGVFQVQSNDGSVTLGCIDLKKDEKPTLPKP